MEVGVAVVLLVEEVEIAAVGDVCLAAVADLFSAEALEVATASKSKITFST